MSSTARELYPERPKTGFEEPVRQLQERGYAVLPNLFSDDEVLVLREALLALRSAAGNVPLYSEKDEFLSPIVKTSRVGLSFFYLLESAPELAPLFQKPLLDAVTSGYLGAGAAVELILGNISDHERPFFLWHNHFAYVDQSGKGFRSLTDWRQTVERPERVVWIVYLDDIDEDGGQLLIHPRRDLNPVKPPFPMHSPDWDGQVVVNCPKGSMVIMDQCVWHAARERSLPGLRMFVGGYSAALHATSYVSPNTRRLENDPKVAPLLESEFLQVPASMLERLASEVQARIPGWELRRIRNQVDGLYFDLETPTGSVVIDTVRKNIGDPDGFIERDGLSWSFQAENSPAMLASIRRAVGVIHGDALTLVFGAEAPVPSRTQESLASLRSTLESVAAGWSLLESYETPPDGLAYEIETPGGDILLTAVPSDATSKAFIQLDGVDYSYRGDVPGDLVPTFRVVVHAIDSWERTNGRRPPARTA